MKIKAPLLLLFVAMATQAIHAGDVIKICGQNLQNYFWSLNCERTSGNGTPASNYSTVEGREHKTQLIVDALAPIQADIYVFNEFECKPEIVRHLAQKLSEATQLPYVALEDGLDYNVAEDPTGLIKSGYIYRNDKVQPYGQSYSTAVGYTMIYPNQMRIQTFQTLASGERFSLSMNHFKAGGTDENKQTRINNAKSLLKGLTWAMDPDILIMGDLNCEVEEEALVNIINSGYEEQLLKYNPGAQSYFWSGGSSLIDHTLANATMAQQVTSTSMQYVATWTNVGRNNAYSDHEPYVVMLNLERPQQQFDLAQSVKAGATYKIAANLDGTLFAALPVPLSKSYDYLLTHAVLDNDGKLTIDEGSSVFTLEDAGNGNYYIRDINGRYFLQNAKSNGGFYNNVSVSANKSQAHAFTFTRQNDGTFMIKSTVSNDLLLASMYNNLPEFGFWSQATETRILPYLYELEEHPSAITEVRTTTTASHVYYNLAGQRIEQPTKGIYIYNGKKVIKR